jgi:PAS domain S-box-containing protein
MDRIIISNGSFCGRADGIIIGVHLVGRNADLKKQAQQNLLQQAKLLSFIEEAVIAVDRNLKIISWNEAASKLHGINAENAIEKRIHHIIPYDFSILNSFSIYRKLSGGFAWNGQVALRYDAGLLLVEPSVTVLKNDHNEIIGFIAVIRRKRDPFLPFFAASEHPLLFKEAQELYRNRALFEMIVEHAPLKPGYR